VIGAGLRRAVALAAAMAFVLGGCITDAPPPTPVPTASPEPQATPTVTAYALDTVTWYGGFVLTFATATSTLDAKGGPVTVELVLSNPGPEDATLDGPIVLASGGVAVEPARESVIPLVAAGRVATATLTFDLGPDFDVPAAAIRVGRPEEHQAIVPLVAGSATTVTLEPQLVEVAVSGQAGELSVQLRSVELRADLPDWRQELDRDVFAVTLTYDAAFRSEFAGGFAFTAANVALRLPDGTTVEPRHDGRSQSVLVIEPGAREIGLQSRFEVPAPGPGRYVLVIRDGTATKDLPFEIPFRAQTA
jgi:hypothetical protein